MHYVGLVSLLRYLCNAMECSPIKRWPSYRMAWFWYYLKQAPWIETVLLLFEFKRKQTIGYSTDTCCSLPSPRCLTWNMVIVAFVVNSYTSALSSFYNESTCGRSFRAYFVWQCSTRPIARCTFPPPSRKRVGLFELPKIAFAVMRLCNASVQCLYNNLC